MLDLLRLADGPTLAGMSAGLAMAVLLGHRIGLAGSRARRRHSLRSAGAPPRAVAPSWAWDQAEMLRVVAAASFAPRPVLNRSEARVFAALTAECARQAVAWRVFAQVNRGEILTCPDRAAFRAINSKRVDMLIVDDAGLPLLAVEYQGSGHHLGTAAIRDAVKKEALRRAGIGYAEVHPGDGRADIALIVRKLVERQRSEAPTPRAGMAR